METATLTSSFIGTSNRGFALYAQDEVRRLIPGTKCTELSDQEVFLMQCPISREEVIARFGAEEPIFVRHLHPVDATTELNRQESDLHRLAALVSREWSFRTGERLAIQVRKQDRLELPYSPAQVREALTDKLEQLFQIEPVPREAERIVSVYVTADTAYVGLSAPSDNLSDWAGGAVRFQREEDQISRAKFKLLEAEQEFGLDLAAFSNGLDIGAAPGGWTSLLLERGLRVTAIDPGDMHPSLVKHPKLTIYRRNARDVQFPPQSFDLLVCDMSWSPLQMAKLLIPLLDALRTGGTAIVTLKLMHGKPFQTVKDTSRTLAPYLELVRAKQLFHNRDEVTLFLIKR
ncbi:SAM-dependent methyltransferase [Paenibacillus sp. HJGM_3]|uniref:SAM-dependent methyltransferase n=1 Tax=Paenibacillus sp. HJGM_3 TaxID=3379816 RepID=UPI00385A1F44